MEQLDRVLVNFNFMDLFHKQLLNIFTKYWIMHPYMLNATQRWLVSLSLLDS